mmetsp:Transcript_105373/g.250873  ORF Transcript_105373/g.250873 Transcript_105373/m.250873 type:complete len:218 (+) Transcript_105373:1205-1858(+)
MVSNENNMLCARVQRCQNVCFENFCSLLNYDYLRPQLLQQLLILGNSSCRHTNNLHLSKKCELAISFQSRLALRVSLQQMCQLGQNSTGFLMGLQEPLAIAFTPLLGMQSPQVLLTPIQAPHLWRKRFVVILQVREPRIVELLEEIHPTLLLFIYLLCLLVVNIKFSLVNLVGGLFLISIILSPICCRIFILAFFFDAKLLERWKPSFLALWHRSKL